MEEYAIWIENLACHRRMARQRITENNLSLPLREFNLQVGQQVIGIFLLNLWLGRVLSDGHFHICFHLEICLYFLDALLTFLGLDGEFINQLDGMETVGFIADSARGHANRFPIFYLVRERAISLDWNVNRHARLWINDRNCLDGSL